MNDRRDLIDVSKFFDEPAAKYHGRSKDYFSSHQLIDFIRSPRYYRQRYYSSAQTPSAAFVVGEAAHCKALEGDAAFFDRFCSSDDAPRNPKTGEIYGATSKAYQEWATAQSKIVLTPSQFRLVSALANSVRAHRVAAEYLRDGKAEQVFRGEYCSVACQIRVDWLNPYGIIVDYKTCDSLEFFERDAQRYGYFIQAAFYRALTRVATGTTFDFKIVATEKQEPYATAVFRVVGLDAVEKYVEKAIGRLTECWENRCFPTGYEEERILNCRTI